MSIFSAFSARFANDRHNFGLRIVQSLHETLFYRSPSTDIVEFPLEFPDFLTENVPFFFR